MYDAPKRYYGSLDDDSEEAERLRQLVLSGGDPMASFQLQPDPNPAPKPTAAPAGPQRDPELDAAWREAQMRALQQANFGNEYGVGEALRDNAPALITSILDIGFNKGRGLGSIVDAAARQIQANRDSDLKRAQAAGTFAVQSRRQVDPFEQFYKQQMLGVHQRNADLRGQGQQAVQQRYETTRSDKIDPNSQFNTTAIDVAGRKRGAQEQAEIDAKHENNPTIAADAGNVARAQAEASTGGRLATEYGYLPSKPTTPLEERQQGRADESLELQREMNRLAREERGDKMRTERRDKFRREAGDLLNIAREARALQGIFGQHPGDLPGVGVYDSNKPAFMQSQADADVIQRLASLGSYGTHEITGASVGGPAEQARIQRMFADLGRNEQTTRTSVRNILEASEMMLRAQSRGREAEAREVLAELGLGDLIPEQPAAAQPPPPAAAPPPNVAPNPSGIQFPPGARPRTVIKRDGTRVDNQPLTDQQAEFLRSQGFQVL